MFKKILLACCISLFAIALVSCSKSGPKDKKELTIFGMFNKMIFQEEWPVFQEAEKATGVHLKPKISQNSTDEKEAFNLMVASGDLPDIIRYVFPKDLEQLGRDGGVIELNDLIEKHAPNIKKFWQENPRLKKEAVSVDGKIYFIPYYTAAVENPAGSIYWIRKDWLDKLNLPVPTTIDELYTTLIAFKTKDPNGNGKQDEIPWFNRINHLTHAMEVLYNIAQVRYPWYMTDKTVEFTPTTEKFKDATKMLAKWYKEGLIDREYFTRDIATIRDYAFGNNLGGFTDDWASTVAVATKYKDKIPEMELVVIMPPKVNGISKSLRPRLVTAGGWSISSLAKDPVAAIEYLDYWFSSEGRRLWNFGREGIEYTIVDGKPKFNDIVLKNPDGKQPLAYLYTIGSQWEMGVVQDYEYERQVSLPQVADGYKLYMDNNVLENIVVPESLKYSEEELKEFTKIDAQITSYANEMTQKWIMGASDIDKDWDAYIKRLNNLGLESALNIQKTAVERFLK